MRGNLKSAQIRLLGLMLLFLITASGVFAFSAAKSHPAKLAISVEIALKAIDFAAENDISTDSEFSANLRQSINFNRNRYYSPALGRFTSKDPIGFNGGMNLYRYADNNPVLFVDPFGLNPEFPLWQTRFHKFCEVSGLDEDDENAQLLFNLYFEDSVYDPEAMLHRYSEILGNMYACMTIEKLVGDKMAQQLLKLIRKEYVKEVEALGQKATDLRTLGKTPESIARQLNAERRALGLKYKNLTPSDELKKILDRNFVKYGDELGPTVDYMRSKGRTWEEIIESASKTGGKDLGY